MPAHFFIWYEIAGDPRTARTAVDAMMAEVARATGIHGRLLMRRDRPTTWMEIYADVADAPGFEHAIAEAALHNALAQHIGGGARHVEAFVAPG
jgi:hypothetical protein